MRVRLWSPLLLLLAGCGGTQNEPEEPLGEGPGWIGPIVRLSPSKGFNGTRSDLAMSSYPRAGTTLSGITSSQVTYVDRTLAITLPTATPTAGETYNARAAGVEITLIEGERRWIAVEGTLRIVSHEALLYSADLEDVRFAPDGASSGSPRGTFALNGRIMDLAYGEDLGPGAVSMTASAGGTNATLSSITSNGKSTVTGIGPVRISIQAPLSANVTRTLSLSLPAAAAGANGSIGKADGQGSMMYHESEPGGLDSRTWEATGGQWRVIARSRSNVEVRLTGVTFAPYVHEVHGVDGAVGTFTLEGTMKR